VTSKIAMLVAGLATVWIVVASPVAHLDHHSLTAHMVQHLLLMVVAAPLILLGSRDRLQLPWRPHPALCWLAGTMTVILWHVPKLFELPLQAPYWHMVEYASFLIAGLLFWYPVIHLSFTTRPWMLPLYLFLATLPCDALASFLAFCGHVVYQPYLSAGRGMFGLSPLEDQAMAGALMWFTVTLAYLIAALVVMTPLLSGERLDGTEA
jgi:cytochrome c oxidase assembly factor CtaG